MTSQRSILCEHCAWHGDESLLLRLPDALDPDNYTELCPQCFLPDSLAEDTTNL